MSGINEAELNCRLSARFDAILMAVAALGLIAIERFRFKDIGEF